MNINIYIKLSDEGFSKLRLSIIVFLILVIAGIAGLAKYNSNQTYKPPTPNNSSITTGTSNIYTTLAPAIVPSKKSECSQQITYTSTGTSGPLTCANGDLNITEWNTLATLEPSVMTLGYNATFSQVQIALCSDVHANIKNNIEELNYQISSLYYGWSFSSDPSIVINNGTCVNTDD